MPRHKRRGGNHQGRGAAEQESLPISVRNETRKLAEALIDATASRANSVEDFSLLHGLVSKLLEIQKECTLRSTTDDAGRLEAAQRLLTEMSANGVDCTSIAVAEYEGQGIGLKATRRISKHEIVLEIPHNFIISSDAAFNSSIGDFLRSDPVCRGMSTMALAVYLLHEACRGTASKWAAYIAALPTTYTNCLFFTPSDLKQLKGSAAQERVAADFKRICRQYAFFFLEMEKRDEAKSLSFRRRFVFDDFRWAVAAVMSRNNPVPQSSTLGCSLGLIPLWDLGNHKFGEMTTDYDPEALVLRFHAMEDAGEGEQVLFHYGNRSNLDFLIYGGFAIEKNPYDRFPVRLGVSDKDPLCNQRMDILEIIGIRVSETFYLEYEAEELPPPLLAFVRVFVMTEDELKKLSDTCTDLLQLNSAILRPGLGERSGEDMEIDTRAARFLQTRFKLLLMSHIKDWDKVETSTVTSCIRTLIASEEALLKKALSLVDDYLNKVSKSKDPEPK